MCHLVLYFVLLPLFLLIFVFLNFYFILFFFPYYEPPKVILELGNTIQNTKMNEIELQVIIIVWSFQVTDALYFNYGFELDYSNTDVLYFVPWSCNEKKIKTYFCNFIV